MSSDRSSGSAGSSPSTRSPSITALPCGTTNARRSAVSSSVGRSGRSGR
ncbi:hypothetical protein [Actinophytocola sp. KF-1]